MNPGDLTPESFSKYPPLAARLASEHLSDLRQLPLCILPSFLDQIIGFDWKFPVERQQLSSNLQHLPVLQSAGQKDLRTRLNQITLPANLSSIDWVNQPAHFVQQLSAYLWSSQQIDQYRTAVQQLFEAIQATQSESTTIPRFVVLFAGPELKSPSYALFSRLQTNGFHLTNVDETGGVAAIDRVLGIRVAAHQQPYGHWWLDGGVPQSTDTASDKVTVLSYATLDPVRKKILSRMQHTDPQPALGAAQTGQAEAVYSQMIDISPAESGVDRVTSDPVLQHFYLNLFTRGSGTQIYSTSFVQWSAREILRRAQPLTLIVHVAPRARQQSFDDILGGKDKSSDLDPAGSLIDADLAAYYTWLELRKLPGIEKSVFLAWFPGHRAAFLSGPGVPQKVLSNKPVTVDQILKMPTAGLTA